VSRPQPSFDRLRPRTTQTHPTSTHPGTAARSAQQPPTPSPGSQGRRPLFSVDEQSEPAFGSILIECSSCRETSVLALRQAMRLAVPSLYLPVIKRRYPAWLHCPACGDWAWARVRIRL
jgi:hypothetical protein